MPRKPARKKTKPKAPALKPARKHTAATIAAAERAQPILRAYIRETGLADRDAMPALVADLMHLCHLNYPRFWHSHANLRRARLQFESEADGRWRNA